MRPFVVALLALSATGPALAQGGWTAPGASGGSAVVADLGHRQDVATVYGFLVPGLGHLYAGETRTGAALLALGALPMASLAALSLADADLDTALDVVLVTGTVGLGAWVYSWVDARRAVRREAARVGAGLAVTPVDGETVIRVAVRVSF